MNILYIDYTSKKITTRTVLFRKKNTICASNKNIYNITNMLIIDDTFSIFVKNNIEYYRINLQHNGQYGLSRKQELEKLKNILTHICSSVYLYIPVNSLNHESIQIGCDELVNEYNLYLNINIHDKIGVFNMIDN
jgi:hypothetical protein